jgi:hypothetical protein
MALRAGMAGLVAVRVLGGKEGGEPDPPGGAGATVALAEATVADGLDDEEYWRA